MILRRASIADREAIERVGLDADERFRDAGHPELCDGGAMPPHVLEAAVAKGTLGVAEVDGAIVGWIYEGRIEGELCIGQVSVAAAFGRRGLGTALVRDVIERARERGEPSIVLNTQRNIPWNAPWYERLGFRVVDRNAWSSALERLAEAQTAEGLDWSSRVHMRLVL